MEFHVSRQARARYQFDQDLFTFSGNVIFANFYAARQFAQAINQKRDLVNFPEQAVKAGQLNALGLIDEILHYVVALYQRQKNPRVMQQALIWLEERLGRETLDKTLLQFTLEFPPLAVYQGKQGNEEYLQGSTEGYSNRAIALEEMMLLWITNRNPAASAFEELFDDTHLSGESAYIPVIKALHEFFETQPRFGPDQQNLIDLLRSPAIAVPHSLFGQLEYIRERWADLIGRFLYRLLSSLDFIKEEEKISFVGPGPVPIPVYDRAMLTDLGEAERFSPDSEWMPRLVLIAKNTYVWLDQLGKKYGQNLTRLDQIPDEELDILAKWGFTGLWLIGVWERSRASARIKQLCGNPEAIASAYSLAGYQIAQELGGEEAYLNLRHRAWQRGIRLGSDMVPNHMGIDSDWVVHHPDWFISLDYSPFTSYTFSGPDLSSDPRVGIYLEDHYYSRSDAAVVFKWVDHHTGQTRYIYHGNDGTNMPWNDTAQLNYLKPEVREAVIQTILDVARKFPIIRFDAAMTLTKRHYQRLWFPEPGSGGDIPSRAGLGLTKAQFDAAMPNEFWREVVDRVAQEVPDTLLLAEAFWLMESYFVRTLGMHRVYNSAFMNLLRNEENAKYRALMKNTLEFDPQILKRYVNFMNNPDERTAVDQFGKGDKYFGVCVLMVTMPGLPMFGHGQIEGFTEKYGMEFRRAYWDEQPDPYLVERHQREIFPLLHRRALFSELENFLLYDFFTSNGTVDENVFAYSNGVGQERALVVYHNRYASTQGWIRTSAAFAHKNPEDGQRQLIQRTLGEGLGLPASADVYLIFRDHISGLEYIRSCKEIHEQGLFLELGAYKYCVFWDFCQVVDDDQGIYGRLCSYLNGRGVPSVDEALKELLLAPIQSPYEQIINPDYFGYLLSYRSEKEQNPLTDQVLSEAAQKLEALLTAIGRRLGNESAKCTIVNEVAGQLKHLLVLDLLDRIYPFPGGRLYTAALSYIKSGLMLKDNWYVLLGWIFTHRLGKMVSSDDCALQTQTWLDEWRLAKVLKKTFAILVQDEDKAERMTGIVRILIGQQNWFLAASDKPLVDILKTWLSDDIIRQFLGVNRFQDVLWFNKEAYEEFIWWMMVVGMFEICADPTLTATKFIEHITALYEMIQRWLEAEKVSDYQLNKLLSEIEG